MPASRDRLFTTEYLGPEAASAAIHILRVIEERLDPTHHVLALHLAWARDAIWAAAYPDDPSSLLDQVAEAAEAVG